MKVAVNGINKTGGLLARQVELIVVDDEIKPEKERLPWRSWLNG